jgi:hypothetical protein
MEPQNIFLKVEDRAVSLRSTVMPFRTDLNKLSETVHNFSFF